ncbi:MAG: hypothetical protein KDD19_16190 [Phaeodactylibacter sp.]|nr:hypothetical protein [Phaeodactylibacter sp.]MCB9048047.1 hypothetical protein [Lewinellaceae bacterium]
MPLQIKNSSSSIDLHKWGIVRLEMGEMQMHFIGEYRYIAHGHNAVLTLQFPIVLIVANIPGLDIRVRLKYQTEAQSPLFITNLRLYFIFQNKERIEMKKKIN